MKKTLLLFFLLSTAAGYAQFPEQWDTLDQTINLRSELKAAIRSEDKKAATNATEGLRNLTDKTHTALMWDERWLVYHWTGRYKLLLNEVKNYGYFDRVQEEYGKIPPADSLFELIDQVMYRQAPDYPAMLEKTDLNPEERFFTDIHLQYLLRNNEEAELMRRDSFLRTFPGTRYKSFIKEFMNLPKRKKVRYFSMDVRFMNNNWSDQLQRNFRPGWGLGAGLYWHYKAVLVGASWSFTRQKLERPIYSAFDAVWQKGDGSSMHKFSGELGLRVLNTSKIAVWPSFEFGWANLASIDTEYDEDDPNYIPLVNYFDFSSGHIGACFTADLKMSKKGTDTKSSKSALYNGVRLKVGYNRLYFGNSDNQLSGNVLFFALGYQFSGR